MKESQNVKLEFYTKLLTLMRSEFFPARLARELVELAKHPEITLTEVEVTFKNLQSLYEGCNFGTDDEGVEIMEMMTENCFRDLAPQMRNEAARALFLEWKKWSGIPDDLFIHVRVSHDLGDGFAAVTVVTDDIQHFRQFCDNPDSVTAEGKVHFSESDAAKDPD